LRRKWTGIINCQTNKFFNYVMPPRVVEPHIGNSHLSFLSVFEIEQDISRFWPLAIQISRCRHDPTKIAAPIQKLVNRFQSLPWFHRLRASARTIPIYISGFLRADDLETGDLGSLNRVLAFQKRNKSHRKIEICLRSLTRTTRLWQFTPGEEKGTSPIFRFWFSVVVHVREEWTPIPSVLRSTSVNFHIHKADLVEPIISTIVL
jgi:hypothetical protein